jgi:hypothetical protein
VAGKQVSFKLKVKFHGGLSTDSSPVSYYIPKAGAVCNTKLKLKQYDSFGQYGGNWSGSDTTYYYVANNKFHVVSVIGHKLYDYTLNSKTHKAAGKKIVNLGKYNVWGGFVQGTDGNFYVAVGYNNLKESKTKTVIKVKKYSSAWKLKKTCNIAGGSKNAFTGIYEPFEAGNCRMAQNGNELYVFTCRTMFKQSDGLHHQSNIAFQINTDNMTYVNHNDSYCSHSFNQYLRYDEDTLYLADHGDAYPRGIQLTKRDANGTQTSKTVFRIKGATGNNYTGVTVGGMEYSANRILIAGTSIPQNYNIKGVNKKRDKSVSNVFVSVTDKNLDSNKVVWLTHYTKKSKTSVSEVRTVKISDYNIAVLYTTTKKKDTKLHYVVLDNEGAVTYQKTYANMAFDGGTQPILNDGSIVWTAYTTDNNYNNILHYYSIPVTFGK